jgi:hypothetical protein
MLWLVLALLVVLAPIAAQADVTDRVLVQPAPFASNLASMPRLAGRDLISQKINAVLEAEDSTTLSLAQDCVQEPGANFFGGCSYDTPQPRVP